MLNPREIDPKHVPPMQAALLKNRSVLDEHLVAKLYKLAKAAYAGEKEQRQDPKVMLARQVSQNGVVTAICTDGETGLFVQLAGDPQNTGKGPFLTFGRKFCQEYEDPMRQNIATKIW
jgi:hypothetical protein